MSTHQIEFSALTLELATKRRGRMQPFVNVDASRTALLVVDMQTGFVAPGSIGEIPSARSIVSNINRLARGVRDAGGVVVWIVSTYGEGAEREWPSFFEHVVTGQASERFRLAFSDGRPEHELFAELERLPGDLTFSKNRMTPFAEPTGSFKALLDSRGIETVLVTGTVTNICCESTARDAAMRNFKTIMISDANAARNDDEHNATLSVFLQAFGGVLSSDEVLSLIKQPRHVLHQP